MPGETTSLTDPAQQFNEEMLIRRIRDGEHDLFYELVRPYERRVYSAALAILRNEADAEDVAQEAVLKALKHIRQFRAESRFSTWLIQITVNEARMRIRRQHADRIEPIDDHQDEEATMYPATLQTGVRSRRRLWSEKRYGKSSPRPWRRSEKSTGKSLSCATCNI